MPPVVPWWAFAALVGVGVAGSPSAPARPQTAFYVTPAGTPRGIGTAARPWDLATALAGAGGRIRAGDTIWLGGGRYPGTFRTALTGEHDRHIVFRQRAGERATIDGSLVAEGAYLTFWGFEIKQSDPVRTNTYGLEARTNGGRFINLIIHDAGTMGVSFWTPGENAELYGCIVYNNGTLENRHHGVYVHNERGTKLVADNIFFNNLAYGIHVYAAPRNPPQQGVRVEGNIVFNNGTIAQRYRAKGNILVGSEVPMTDMQVLDNLLYFSNWAGDNLRLGYKPVDNGSLVVRGNFVWGGETALRWTHWTNARVEGNTLGGAKALGTPVGPGNTYYRDGRTPAAPAVFVRPNRYEPGRAYVAVYNWTQVDSVAVDLSGVLAQEQRYEVRNVQDLFGPAVASGTYRGGSVRLPMTGVPPSLPIGRTRATPPRTAPSFDAFVVTVSEPAAPTGRSRSRVP